MSLPAGHRSKALREATRLTGGERRRQRALDDFTRRYGELTTDNVVEYAADWVEGHKSSGLPARLSALKAAAAGDTTGGAVCDWAEVDRVVVKLRQTYPSVREQMKPYSEEVEDQLWRHLRPLGTPEGSDVRAFMGMASLAALFMVRVTAMVGRNLRPSDLRIRWGSGRRATLTLSRVLGKTSKTDARPQVRSEVDTSPGGRVGRLLTQLREEAVARRGEEGALFVRGTGDPLARVGANWTPPAVTAVLRKHLVAAGVDEARAYATKSFKVGAVTGAQARKVPGEAIRHTGGWRAGSRAVNNYLADGAPTSVDE